MIRAVLLALTSPLWLPFRTLRALLARRRGCPVVRLTLTGDLPDLRERSGLLARLRPEGGMTLTALLDLTDRMVGDDRLETVLVRLDALRCGIARAEEARAALARLRRAGKQVIAYSESLDLPSYWIALGASSIRLAPPGGIDVSGVASEITLARGLLDRLGVRAQMRARGEYKSMRETFTETQASEANRTMTRALVDDLAEQLYGAIAEARGQSPEQVSQRLNGGPFRADEALHAGLVDQLQYWDELAQEFGEGKSAVTSAARYARRIRARRILPKRPSAKVALLQLTGNIRTGHDRFGPGGKRATGHQSLCRQVRQARKNPSVLGILLRVDSPGGSALASDLMWRELSLAAASKPLVISMANVAASGGYYASGVEGATTLALPNTITGSIGVVAGKFEISGLLERLGVVREAITSGPRAGYHSASRPWNDDDLAKLDRDVDHLYEDFVAKMAKARGLDFEALERVARGRVWTGRQALERGLVDGMGGLFEAEQALREALELPGSKRIGWLPAATGGVSEWRARRGDDDAAIRTIELFERSAPLPLRGVAASATEWAEAAVDFGGERLLTLLPLGRRPGS